MTTSHQKAWATRRKAASAKAKSEASKKGWATRNAAKTKKKSSAKTKNQAKNKAKKKAAVLNAAQKAWITRKAKVVATTAVNKAPKYSFTAQVKQVKGVIAGTVTQQEVANLIATAKVQPVVAKKATKPTPVVPPVKSVAELFSVDSRWVKRRSAQKANGEYTAIESAEAAAFCLSGGIHRVYGANAEQRTAAFRKVEEVIKGYSLGKVTSVVGFNDNASTTINDVRRVVAIAGI
ncbi:hypothetical protein [Acinetobacter sp.]|uniref:hypothetical protein n=1 Tax=Acinetobacter sp. TaxID=472 RepID=UPI0037535396